jgi:hypothetical protein
VLGEPRIQAERRDAAVNDAESGQRRLRYRYHGGCIETLRCAMHRGPPMTWPLSMLQSTPAIPTGDVILHSASIAET